MRIAGPFLFYCAKLLCYGVLLATTAQLARPNVIVTVDGSFNGSTGVAGIAAGWSTPVPLQDVRITALLTNGLAPPASGTAFLTTSIGPGTTLAQLVAQTAVTVSCSVCLQEVTLFTGLNLPAGTYWISFTKPSDSFLSWALSNPAVISTSAGAQYLGFAYLNGGYDPFPAGNSFLIPPDPDIWTLGYDFSVTTVPEPASLYLFIAGFAAILAKRRRSS